MIILDTNVLSELIRKPLSQSVSRWISRHPATSLFTTVITEAELLFGVALLPNGRRRNLLTELAKQMLAQDFADRVLPFDGAAAQAYAPIAAARRQQGRPIAPFDAQIAAIALSRGATLATRNVADFERTGVGVFNPWWD